MKKFHTLILCALALAPLQLCAQQPAANSTTTSTATAPAPAVAYNNAAIANREFIVLTGAVSLHKWEKYKGKEAHDHWWANFVHQSKNRFVELRKQYGPNAFITWLVYKEGYVRRAAQDHKDEIGFIKSVAQKYNLHLVWVNSGKDVIRYLNTGQPRNKIKIADFEYFGHSNCACWLLDYSNQIDSASKAWLHENQMKNIRGSDFASNAFVKSYGCHTGEQMSQVFRRDTGVKMWGAVGKTDYSNYSHVFISTPGGHWSY